MGLANIKGRSKIAMRHLSRVNSWSQEQTDRYVEEQFALWLRRSEHEWLLDVSWLEQHGICVARRDREQEDTSEDMLQWLTKEKPAEAYEIYTSSSSTIPSETRESIHSLKAEKPGKFWNRFQVFVLLLVILALFEYFLGSSVIEFIPWP